VVDLRELFDRILIYSIFKYLDLKKIILLLELFLLLYILLKINNSYFK